MQIISKIETRTSVYGTDFVDIEIQNKENNKKIKIYFPIKTKDGRDSIQISYHQKEIDLYINNLSLSDGEFFGYNPEKTVCSLQHKQT